MRAMKALRVLHRMTAVVLGSATAEQLHSACGEGWHIRRHLVHVSDRRAKLPHAGFRRVSLVVAGGAQNDARSLSEIQIVYIVTVQQLRDQGRGQ